MTAGEFFSSGHRVIGKLVAWGPVTFGVRFGVASVLVLLIPARIVKVHSVPLGDDDVGLWFEANWSLMFPIVLPLLFGGFIYMISLMQRAIAELSNEPLRVIVKGGEAASDYVAYISKELGKRARAVTWISLSLAAVLTIIDTIPLSTFLFGKSWGRPEKDWAIAFTLDPRVDRTENIVFDVMAYSAQACAIFIGFFFVLKFWLFLQVFSNSIRGATEYEFSPLVRDPYRRLGLRPLGGFMNLYLLIAIGFEIYVLGRRLQLIGKHGEYSLAGYLSELIAGAKSFTNVLDPKIYQWSAVNIGLWLLLIFLTLPLIVGAYFPLWTLRRFVAQKRNELYLTSARAYDDAVQRGDDEAAEDLKERMLALEDTQLWPNGDAAGWRLLSISIAIGIAAWAPPLFAYFVAIGVTAEFGRLLGALRTKMRSGAG